MAHATYSCAELSRIGIDINCVVYCYGCFVHLAEQKFVIRATSTSSAPLQICFSVVLIYLKLEGGVCSSTLELRKERIRRASVTSLSQ